jgi:hypothetical protein
MDIYSVDDTNPAQPKAKTLLGTLTETFEIPYRPSSDSVHCPGGQQWYSKSDNQCYHGFAVPVTFDFSDQQISLPSKIAVGVAYNTETAGPSPLGPKPCDNPATNNNADCPYDSLNISTYGDVFFNFDGALPLASSVIDPNGIFVNYINPANACNKATTPGVFEDDTTPSNGEPATETCFTGYHPELQISAKCGHDGLPKCPRLIGSGEPPKGSGG